MQLKAICQQNCEHFLKYFLIMFIRIDICTTDNAKIATNISKRLLAVLRKKGLLGQFINGFLFTY